MALIRCEECGAEISSFAYSCPRCGYSRGARDRALHRQEFANSISETWRIYKSKIIRTIGSIFILWAFLHVGGIVYVDWEVNRRYEAAL